MLLGTVGFAAIGKLFAAVSLRARGHARVMLPLVMPAARDPLIIAAIRRATDLLAGARIAEVAHYLNLLGA